MAPLWNPRPKLLRLPPAVPSALIVLAALTAAALMARLTVFSSLPAAWAPASSELLSAAAEGPQARSLRQRKTHAAFVAQLHRWDAHLGVGASSSAGSASAAAALLDAAPGGGRAGGETGGVSTTLAALALAPDAPARVLVVYTYAHADWRLQNLEFFLRHGLAASTRDGAPVDYTFVFNGEAPLEVLQRLGLRYEVIDVVERTSGRAGRAVGGRLRRAAAGDGDGRAGGADGSGGRGGEYDGANGGDIGGDKTGGGRGDSYGSGGFDLGGSDFGGAGPGYPGQPLISVVLRENQGFDMCGSKLALERGWAPRPGTYTRVILMNASVRGPFMPSYVSATEPWVDAFLSRLGGPDGVRLVGTTINCLSSRRDAESGAFSSLHVQSMVLALDRAAVRTLHPMLRCYDGMLEAIAHGEVGSTQAVLAAGYAVAALQGSWRGFAVRASNLASDEVARRCAAVSEDTGGDPAAPGAYMEGELHPYEIVFIKTNRHLDPEVLERFTRLHDRYA